MPDVAVADLLPVLAALHGQPVRRFTRAATMLMVEIGELQEVLTRKHGIQLECDWRLSRPPVILVGDGDFYVFADRDESYDFNSREPSRFDRLMEPVNEGLATPLPCIREISLDGVGGFSLHLESGLKLDVFPDQGTGSGEECWRLLQNGTAGIHWVFG